VRFNSIDVVKAFTGDDYERAHISDAAATLVSGYADRCAHFALKGTSWVRAAAFQLLKEKPHHNSGCLIGQAQSLILSALKPCYKLHKKRIVIVDSQSSGEP